MTVRLLSKPDYSLLPIICTCVNCKKLSEASEFADFTYLFRAGNDGDIESITVCCPACSSLASPPADKKAALISSYQLWLQTGKPARPTPAASWSKQFRCPECKSTSTITIEDIKVYNSAVAYAGEDWEPKVKIICSICKTASDAGRKVPQGIQDRVLTEAEIIHRQAR